LAEKIYLFERVNEEWTETAILDNWGQKAALTASNADVNDRFGSAVSLSAYAKTLVAGAKYKSLSGAAYLY